jgi:hypothetical protein
MVFLYYFVAFLTGQMIEDCILIRNDILVCEMFMGLFILPFTCYFIVMLHIFVFGKY